MDFYVINGKRYERFEDIPDGYRKLLTDFNGTGTSNFLNASDDLSGKNGDTSMTNITINDMTYRSLNEVPPELREIAKDFFKDAQTSFTRHDSDSGEKIISVKVNGLNIKENHYIDDRYNPDFRYRELSEDEQADVARILKGLNRQAKNSYLAWAAAIIMLAGMIGYLFSALELTIL